MSSPKPYEDNELLALLRQDDKRAITEIYGKYWERLYLSAFSILRDDSPCQDIVQEVLYQLWSRREHLQIESLQAYLYKSIRYKVLTYISSAHNRKVYLEDGELEKLAGESPIADRLNEHDIARLLERGLNGLTERARQVYLMSRQDHLSNREIAEKLGITVKGVEAQITLALKHLRVTLGDFLFWATVVMPIFMSR